MRPGGRSRIPAEGAFVIAHLREPREKVWGILLSCEGSGVWLRGIDVNSFEDWVRQIGSEEGGALGLSTLFYPFLRVEKLSLDEPAGAVPSMVETLHRIAGDGAAGLLEG